MLFVQSIIYKNYINNFYSDIQPKDDKISMNINWMNSNKSLFHNDNISRNGNDKPTPFMNYVISNAQ